MLANGASAKRNGEQRPPTNEPLVLVNGLAEQAESWFANREFWSRHFAVEEPEILVYNGEALHSHISSGGEVTVEYLTQRLTAFLEDSDLSPPYNLVGSSLGGQIVLSYAARYPEKVSRLVLLCPSGLHGEESLPVMQGVKRSRYDSLVGSVFHSQRFATEELVESVARKFADRDWKKGVLHTLRGTVGHSVAGLLEQVRHPCLTIWGARDNVIQDVPGSVRAAARMPGVRQAVIPGCGHAPQIEKSRLVNPLVLSFLSDGLEAVPRHLSPERFLGEPEGSALSQRSYE